MILKIVLIVGLILPAHVVRSDEVVGRTCQFVSLKSSVQFVFSRNSAPDPEIMNLIRQVMDAFHAGLDPTFAVTYSTQTPIAAAHVSPTNNNSYERKIVLNPNVFPKGASSKSTTPQNVLVLAHEIGHHIFGHSLSSENIKASEKAADQFAGGVLKTFNFSKDQSVAAMRELLQSGNYDSTNYPPPQERVAAVQFGWEEMNKKVSVRNTELNFKSGTYSGDVKNGKANGQGVWMGSDGIDWYQGDFKDNSRHGSGVYINQQNGDRYEGQWASDRWHGHGTFTAKNGKYIAAGDFRNGQLHGYATVEYADGSHYDGDFVQGRREGKGSFKWPNDKGDYTGDWYNDKMHGCGVMNGPNSKDTVWAYYENGQYIGRRKECDPY